MQDIIPIKVFYAADETDSKDPCCKTARICFCIYKKKERDWIALCTRDNGVRQSFSH